MATATDPLARWEALHKRAEALRRDSNEAHREAERAPATTRPAR